jgi:hypothetical protein
MTLSISEQNNLKDWTVTAIIFVDYMFFSLSGILKTQMSSEYKLLSNTVASDYCTL